jgi:hypothetical protein
MTRRVGSVVNDETVSPKAVGLSRPAVSRCVVAGGSCSRVRVVGVGVQSGRRKRAA